MPENTGERTEARLGEAPPALGERGALERIAESVRDIAQSLAQLVRGRETRFIGVSSGDGTEVKRVSGVSSTERVRRHREKLKKSKRLGEVKRSAAQAFQGAFHDNAAASFRSLEATTATELPTKEAATKRSETVKRVSSRPRKLTPERAAAKRSLSDAMVEVFAAKVGRKYVFAGPKDAQALDRLLDTGLEQVELLRRWAVALGSRGFHECRSIALFASRVNDYAEAPRDGLNEWQRKQLQARPAQSSAADWEEARREREALGIKPMPAADDSEEIPF